MKLKVTKAVVPILGYDPGLLPATKTRPKELLPLLDRPIIDLAVDEAVAAGIEEAVVITRLCGRSVRDHLEYHDVELEYLLKKAGLTEDLLLVRGQPKIRLTFVQPKRFSDLSEVLLATREIIGEMPFVLILPDDVLFSRESCLKSLVAFYGSNTAPAAVALVPEAGSRSNLRESLVGRWEGIGSDSDVFRLLRNVVNCEAATDRLELAGRFVLPPEIFDWIEPSNHVDFRSLITKALVGFAEEHIVLGHPIQGQHVRVEDTLGYLTATVESALQRQDLGDEFREYLLALRSHG